MLHVQDSHVQAREDQEGQQVAVLRLPVLGLLDEVIDTGDNRTVLSAGIKEGSPGVNQEVCSFVI